MPASAVDGAPLMSGRLVPTVRETRTSEQQRDLMDTINRRTVRRLAAGADAGTPARSVSHVAVVVAGALYLVWRAGWTLGSGAPWFSVPLFILEAWAIGDLAVTVAVLRRARRRPTSVGDRSDGVAGPHDVAVVVDAAAASADALRRTLVSLGSLAPTSFVVLVADDDPVVASSVTRAGGRVPRRPDARQGSGLLARRSRRSTTVCPLDRRRRRRDPQDGRPPRRALP